jgi:polar amino acid transport system permease protein
MLGADHKPAIGRQMPPPRRLLMIGVPELTFVAQDITADTFRGFEATTAATIGYVALALVVSGAMALLVRKWRGNHMA